MEMPRPAPLPMSASFLMGTSGFEPALESELDPAECWRCT